MEKEDLILEERKKQVLAFLKNKYNWIIYLCLAVLVYFSYWLRTLNLEKLKDVTTGGWTLGPDLDPFLFLRWAKHIVANGSLMAIDTMRSVPLGFETEKELILLPYLIAYFHKFAYALGFSTSVDQSAVLFPAFMFALTVIVFFLLTRKIFLDKLGETKSGIIALIASFFLTVIPSLLPRTIAGIPEKESAGFFFLFISFYFFLTAWKSKKPLWSYLFAVLAGVMTGAMNLVWGGSAYIYYTIGVSVLISFIFGQLDKRKTFVYLLWIILGTAILFSFTLRFSLFNYLKSIPMLIIIITALSQIVLKVLNKNNISAYIENNKFTSKIPKSLLSFIIVILSGLILSLLFLGPSFLLIKLNEVKDNLVTPIVDRLGITVAENRQPFFPEWSSSFGPIIGNNIPLFFWLFFFGSVYLVYMTLSIFSRKERIYLTLSYLIFLICLIFSRHTPDSSLNGTNVLSIFVYVFGFVVLIGSFGFYYYKLFKNREESKLKEIDFGFILLLVLFFLSIVSARGAVRLIMVLVPSSSILVSYFLVSAFDRVSKFKDHSFKLVAWILVFIISLATIYAGYQFYLASKATSENFAPSIYTQQWQYAMSWVRENTPQNSVFAHWWDYGYWVQSIGERATVLDGGNVYPYWDYLMGRYALTGIDDRAALEFLYTHNTTHFLIDSTDIGKYGAFSSIGSDENYDRASWISSFSKSKVTETKNGTLTTYTGGTSLDADIIYTINSTQVFLPSGKAGVGGFFVERDSTGKISKPVYGAYVYQNKQYTLPLRYVYSDGKLIDFGPNSGIEAGIYTLPFIRQSQTGIAVDKDGVLLYLSNRTVNSQLARLYLYNEDNPYFKLVHSEDDLLVKELKSRNITSEEIVYFNEIRGPIKILEIKYPQGMRSNPEYLKTEYPNKELGLAK